MSAATKLQMKDSLGAPEVCAYCGKQTAHSTSLNHTFGHGAELVVVENVATMVCSNCGQSYFTGTTLAKLDEIPAAPANYASQQLVQVAGFSQL